MITIIVPTYKEEEVIGRFLKKVKAVMGNENYDVLIVDDSPDMGTVRRARKAAQKFGIKLRVIHRQGKKGKGSAIKNALRELKSDITVMIDADLEYDPAEIPKMVEKLRNCDIVTSVRRRKDPFHRRILGEIFKVLVGILFNLHYDTQSGLKVFRTKVLKSIKTTNKGWIWDLEFLYKAHNRGYCIKKHPIIFRRRKYGKSKVKPLKTSIDMFKDMIKLRMNFK